MQKRIKRGTLREDGKRFNCYQYDKEVWITQAAWDKINRNSQLRRWANKLKVYENYGGCCNECGEADPLVLQIDHVKDNGKDHVDKKGRRVTGNELYSQIMKAGYPKDEYQLLCANCNARKEWFRRGAYCGEN
jgi:hypothetical protein